MAAEKASGHHIAVASRLSGLTPEVIRSWERRYGIVRPERDAAGLRLYSSSQIERLRLARRATERGHAIRKIAPLSDAEIAALLQSNDERDTAQDGLVEEILAAIRNDDPERVKRTLNVAAMVLGPEELVLSVLVPLMCETGKLWLEREISIWQEHLLSQAVSSVALMTMRLQHRSNIARCFVFGTPPGEQHALGITFAAMLTASRGFAAENLGANVPVQEIIDAAARMQAACVVVGITRPDFNAAEAVEYLERLDAGLPSDVEIWLGGPRSADYATSSGSPRLRRIATLEEFARLLDGRS